MINSIVKKRTFTPAGGRPRDDGFIFTICIRDLAKRATAKRPQRIRGVRLFDECKPLLKKAERIFHNL